MFVMNETVCIQNEYGLYVPYLFKGLGKEGRCILESKSENGSGNVVTELIVNVFKTEQIIRLIDSEISECYAMIDHFIKLKNKEEIACWRKYLQAAKLQKRRMKDL